MNSSNQTHLTDINLLNKKNIYNIINTLTTLLNQISDDTVAVGSLQLNEQFSSKYYEIFANFLKKENQNAKNLQLEQQQLQNQQSIQRVVSHQKKECKIIQNGNEKQKKTLSMKRSSFQKYEITKDIMLQRCQQQLLTLQNQQQQNKEQMDYQYQIPQPNHSPNFHQDGLSIDNHKYSQIEGMQKNHSILQPIGTSIQQQQFNFNQLQQFQRLNQQNLNYQIHEQHYEQSSNNYQQIQNEQLLQQAIQDQQNACSPLSQKSIIVQVENSDISINNDQEISKANEQNEGAHRKVNNQNYQAIIYQFVLQQQEARSQGLAQLQEQQNEVQNKQQNTQYQCSLNQQFGLSQNNKPFLYDYINQESGMLNLSNGGFDYCNLNLNQPNLIQSNSHKLNQSSILLYEHIPQEESLLEIKQIQKRIEDSLQQETNRNGINQEFRFENNMNQYIQKVDNNNNKILDNDESLNSTFQEKFNPTRFLGQINPQNENESQNQVQPTKFMGQINDSSYIRNNIREGINDYDQEEKKESFQGINSSNNLGELNQEEQLNQNRNAEYNQFQKQESEEIGQEDYECTLFSEFTKDEIGMNEVSSESVITFIDKLKQGNKGKIPQVQQEQKLELIKQSEKSYLCKGPEYLIYLLKYEPIIKKMLQVKFIFENNNQLEEKSKKFQQIVFLIVNPNSIEFLKQLVEIVQKYLNVHKSIIEDTQLGRAIYNHKPFRKELRDQKVMIYYNTDQKAMMWYSYSKYTDELEQLAKNYLTKYSFKRVFIQNNFQEKGIKDVKMNQVQINHLNKIAKAREEGLNEFFQHKKSESTAIISMHFQLSKQGIIPNYKYYSNSITFQFKNEDKIFYEEIIDNFRSYIKDRIEYVVKNESNPQGVGQFSYKYVLKNNYLINGIESKSSIEFLNPTAEYNNILPENKKIIDIIREYTTLQPINGVYTLNDQNIKTILQKLDTY